MNYYYPTESKPLYRGTQIIWYIASIIEIILFFRFILRLIGASTAAPFTNFIYGLASPFVGPFMRVVPSPTVGGGVFDWNTLIAMLVYWILATIVVRLLVMGKPVTTLEAHQKLEAQEHDTTTPLV